MESELRALLTRLADWMDDSKAEHDLEGSTGYCSLWENVLKDAPLEEGDPLLERLRPGS